MVFINLAVPYAVKTVVFYLEWLAQNNLRGPSLCNHVSVLRHYFSLFDWPCNALSHRKVNLLLNSVDMNAKIYFRVKGIFDLKLLKKLIQAVMHYLNAEAYDDYF